MGVGARGVRLGLVLGLALALLVSGIASGATSRSASSLDHWGSIGVWGAWTDFHARWKQTKSSVWLFEDFQLDAVVANGKDCPAIICQAWTFTGDVRFYDANNVQVGETLTPPMGFCTAVATNARDRVFGRCRPSPWGVLLRASKLKMTWGVWIQRNGFWIKVWSGTKTVAI
jgi:hypothetical protein